MACRMRSESSCWTPDCETRVKPGRERALGGDSVRATSWRSRKCCPVSALQSTSDRRLCDSPVTALSLVGGQWEAPRPHGKWPRGGQPAQNAAPAPSGRRCTRPRFAHGKGAAGQWPCAAGKVALRSRHHSPATIARGVRPTCATPRPPCSLVHTRTRMASLGQGGRGPAARPRAQAGDVTATAFGWLQPKAGDRAHVMPGAPMDARRLLDAPPARPGTSPMRPPRTAD